MCNSFPEPGQEPPRLDLGGQHCTATATRHEEHEQSTPAAVLNLQVVTHK